MKAYLLHGGIRRHDDEDGWRHHVEEDAAADVLAEVVGAALVLAAIAYRRLFNAEVMCRETAHIRL